ncbi:electron transport complex subunit C [Marinobacterium zhoushanense]|uniref:Ion-translocating oxidoreductase complex subunit C n=1 Tax=Marinobacterium zhoushanense TaxID=1679163 RepID=A0ABQ1KIK6_9GAMM|nr:electron transport complex subunit RsxC [Marinobacterium zhoushanense]GGC00925.1 electron transport complex subunit C [Marinobacterium zhoushanense]
MSKVFSFHGGIHPPGNKKRSTRAAIGKAPLPKTLVVPMQQHIGGPADPLVKIGDQVLKGQLIAEPISRISAAIHAPTSGKVVDVAAYPIPHASGLSEECIVIESDGEDRWIEHQGLDDYRQLRRQDLIEHIRNCGIAGMGGAGFPTDVKLHLSEDHIVNTLIINAAECEPYITADDMLMRERAHEVLGGIEIIAHLLRPSHVLIGIEDNKPNAIHALEAVLKDTELNIDIVVVPTKYPSGGERQLIKLLTDLEVPSGRIPADIGIVCQNVGTTAAVYRAVHYGEPLISRIVTVTGDAVLHPRNLETLIGTPFSTLLEACDLRPEALSKLVMGGPMMGVTVENDQIPVIKTTNCLIAATAQEMPLAPPAQACIRCGMCEQACPAELLPQQLYWFAKGREFDKAKHHNLFDCIECGACAYVCPSNIPLVQYYRYAKSEIRTEQRDQQKADHARQRFEARQARLEREVAEKEARRKARAEEAAKAQQQKAATQSDASPQPAAAAEPDAKQLKTAAAVARTKLKKAQKAYDEAVGTNADNLAELEAALNDARSKAEAAEKALAAGAPATEEGSGDDLKQLKVAAAVARTKLKKAQDALKNAEDKGLDGVDKLRATLVTLENKAEEAQQAYEQAANKPASPSPAPTEEKPAEVDIKALKQQVSIMRTKLKKAESALDGCEDEAEIARMKTEVNELKQRFEQATAEFDKAEQALIERAAKSGIDLKQLRIDAAMARAAVTKGERSLSKADNDDERSQIEQELTSARAKADELNLTLSQYE